MKPHKKTAPDWLKYESWGQENKAGHSESIDAQQEWLKREIKIHEEVLLNLRRLVHVC